MEGETRFSQILHFNFFKLIFYQIMLPAHSPTGLTAASMTVCSSAADLI